MWFYLLMEAKRAMIEGEVLYTIPKEQNIKILKPRPRQLCRDQRNRERMPLKKVLWYPKEKMINNGLPLVQQGKVPRVFWSFSWIKTSCTNTFANEAARDTFKLLCDVRKEYFYWFILNERERKLCLLLLTPSGKENFTVKHASLIF